MHEPRIVSIGRAVPERTYTQIELVEHSPWEQSPLIERLMFASPIRTRSLFVPPEFFRRPRTLSETNAAWRAGALALGGQALDDALASAGIPAEAVGMIGVTTVTGYTTPGLDLLLAHAHGLRPTVDRIHFNNIGCHAAVPLLRAVGDHVARRPGTVGLAVAVEVCSACFSADSDTQNVVAAALFGDGAACVALSTDGDGPALVDFASAFDFEHIEALGFDLTSDGFRIVLDPRIPDRIAVTIASVIDTLLTRNGLQRADVALWGLHPGGSRILDAAQQALGLTDAQLLPSRRVLRNHGNMSSPTILFVLAEALATDPPRPGSVGVLAAFGPGLGIEAVLLRF
ncbi:MAG: type III polyketide synthase [Myxococcota bacterium]